MKVFLAIYRLVLQLCRAELAAKLFSRKTTGFILLVLILTGVSGCWSRREIEDLAIPGMIGFDQVEIRDRPMFRFSILVIRPQHVSGGAMGGGVGDISATRLLTSIGQTPQDAERNVSSRSPRRMFMAHSRVIVIGEKLAQAGVRPVLDFTLRHKDIRLRNWVVVTSGEASKFMEVQPEIEKTGFDEVSRLLSITQPRVSKAVAVDLREFAATMSNPGRDAVASRFEVFKPMEKTGAKIQGETIKETIRLKGAAVFRDDKLVGWMEDRATRGYLLAVDKAKSSVYAIFLPQHKGEQEKKPTDFSFVLSRSQAKIETEILPDKIRAVIKVNAEGDVGEHFDRQLKIAKPANIKMINKLIGQNMAGDIREAIRVSQELRSDIFGVGDAIHRSSPKFWKEVQKNWHDFYPDVEFQVSVEANIRRTGLLTESLEIK